MVDYKEHIAKIPDYPKKGIMFYDLTTLMTQNMLFNKLMDDISSLVGSADFIVGIEARGFIIGSAIAVKSNAGFIPIRKKGKLPRETMSARAVLEYGEAELEIHRNDIKNDARIVLVDDVLATGGTASTAIDLVRSCGGRVSKIVFALELSKLNGRKLLEDKGVEVGSVIRY
jgi:adenine phosphoribosyltransferase